MEYRNLEVTLISAKGLKKSSFIGKIDVYATASISDIVGNTQKLKTHVDKEGGCDPTWNFPMKFTVNESALQQNRLTLVIKIKSVGMVFDKSIGEVHAPIKELLDGNQSVVSYQVKRMSGKPHGSVSFSYKFGDKFEEPVIAYPPTPQPPTSNMVNQAYQAQPYAQQPPVGYPQQPSYGSYQPPPPPPGYGGNASQPVQRNRLGTGFGTGLLGGAVAGMLIGDIMSHGGGGCGGGCGGGGCGGGCGGGGCGGGCGC